MRNDTPDMGHVARRFAVVGYGVLCVVISCVAAMSWTGLVGFGTEDLNLSAPFVYLVPVSLDGAALTTAFLALTAVMRGDSAFGARAMTLAFVGASSWFNVAHASEHGGLLAAEFFGGMSVAGWAIFELALRHVRRDALRVAGALESPLPRFRGARWMRFPGATFRAWSVAVERGITNPSEALAVAQNSNQKAIETANDHPAAGWNINGTVTSISDHAFTKEQCLRNAFAEIGELNVPEALRVLASKGVKVDRKYAYAVAKKVRENPQS